MPASPFLNSRCRNSQNPPRLGVNSAVAQVFIVPVIKRTFEKGDTSMRHAIGLTLAASVSAVALGAVAIPPAHAADMGVPDYGYQQPPQGYYPPPQQSEAYPPPPVAYGYPAPPPPPVAYYAYPPAPVVVGGPYPYYGYGPYWRGYGPRVAYGYGHGGHYRRW
jgi:hypothetical protein